MSEQYKSDGGEPISILIVDDDKLDRQLYRRHLSNDIAHSYRISEAESCREALCFCAHEAPDCVLLDYVLPDDNGITCMSKLKKTSRASELPVIMLTGHGSESIAVEAIKSGADDYLPKRDLSTINLSRSIEHVVAKSKLKRQLDMEKKSLTESNLALLRKQEEIIAFYHSVSHEIKTPLTAILEFICIVLDKICGEINEEQRRCLEIAKSGCMQINNQINDLLDSARLDTGKLNLTLKAESIEVTLQEAINTMKITATSSNVTLRKDTTPNLPLVNIDQKRILQVLLNLISNAIKFSKSDGGEITLSAYPSLHDDRFIRISVKDTGIGIDKSHLSRIFDRLYQTDNSNMTLGSKVGLGLGLNICREIINMHNCEMSVQSQRGVGTTFSFTLPVAIQQSQLRRA